MKDKHHSQVKEKEPINLLGSWVMTEIVVTNGLGGQAVESWYIGSTCDLLVWLRPRGVKKVCS